MLRSAVGVLGAIAVVAGLVSQAPAQENKPQRPTIDVVLCLDVSGSMGGLIDSAKARLWDIVNDLGKVQPTPNLRVALYSYGHTTYDPRSGWVRKEVDLTTDLDEIYKKLFALTINGGEEYVARVTRAALLEQKWSTDRKALKIIYVCGNEPASQDPVHKLKDVARIAVEKDVVVNTIYCGRADSSDANDWKDFARLAEGRFASIDQQRGVVAISTPHDKKLAELSARLNSTYVAYGKAEAQKEAKDKQRAQDANAGKQGGVAAARAATKASNLYRNAQWDLVDRLKEDPKFDLKKLKEEELCEEMRKLKPEEREAYVKKKAAERLAIQKEIQELAKKRDEYIREQNKKNPTKGDQAFDAAVRGALRDQAAKKGIKIPD